MDGDERAPLRVAENSWERVVRESIARHAEEVRAEEDAERAKHPLFWKVHDAYWLTRMAIFTVALIVLVVVLLVQWVAAGS